MRQRDFRFFARSDSRLMSLLAAVGAALGVLLCGADGIDDVAAGVVSGYR